MSLRRKPNPPIVLIAAAAILAGIAIIAVAPYIHMRRLVAAAHNSVRALQAVNELATIGNKSSNEALIHLALDARNTAAVREAAMRGIKEDGDNYASLCTQLIRNTNAAGSATRAPQDRVGENLLFRILAETKQPIDRACAKQTLSAEEGRIGVIEGAFNVDETDARAPWSPDERDFLKKQPENVLAVLRNHGLGSGYPDNFSLVVVHRLQLKGACSDMTDALDQAIKRHGSNNEMDLVGVIAEVCKGAVPF